MSCYSCLALYFHGKTKKTSSSSVPRLLEYKIVEKNWIEKSLVPFNARNWLQYDKDREYAINLGCKVCTQFRELIEVIKNFKEDWIPRSTNYYWPNAINQAGGVSHKNVCFSFSLVRFIF